MTTEDLKTILVNHLNFADRNSNAVNHEIVDQLIRGEKTTDLISAEAMVLQVDGTAIFLSDSGLAQPKRVVFLDLKSKESFLQELEP